MLWYTFYTELCMSMIVVVYILYIHVYVYDCCHFAFLTVRLFIDLFVRKNVRMFIQLNTVAQSKIIVIYFKIDFIEF